MGEIATLTHQLAAQIRGKLSSSKRSDCGERPRVKKNRIKNNLRLKNIYILYFVSIVIISLKISGDGFLLLMVF
jgi:hypothetical protein